MQTQGRSHRTLTCRHIRADSPGFISLVEVPSERVGRHVDEDDHPQRGRPVPAVIGCRHLTGTDHHCGGRSAAAVSCASAAVPQLKGRRRARGSNGSLLQLTISRHWRVLASTCWLLVPFAWAVHRQRPGPGEFDRYLT